MPRNGSDLRRDLVGRRAIVTGANGGLGLETARALARRGARVVLACRDPERGRAARESILADAPDADVAVAELDLASLASVRAFVGGLERGSSGADGLDLLVNNAGVMALPFRRTADGFEIQMGTNHLGHFALSGLLLDRLLATPGARVVTVSSNLHRLGRLPTDPGALRAVLRPEGAAAERRYGKWQAYARSKLANLLFTFELARRVRARGGSLLAVTSHPGYAATNLQLAGPRMEGATLLEIASRIGNRLLAQSAEQGALPTIHAATAPDVEAGAYYAPGGPLEMWGPPRRVEAGARARDPELALRLWQVSEELTGVHPKLQG